MRMRKIMRKIQLTRLSCNDPKDIPVGVVLRTETNSLLYCLTNIHTIYKRRPFPVVGVAWEQG